MTPSAAASTAHSGMGAAHPHDPAKQSEHNAAMALAFSGTPTHVAKQNGSWFDPDTWQGGKVPGNNAKVVIGKGISVTYDGQSEARLLTLGVEGDLKFSTNQNTKMVIDTFVVSPEGQLEIGTADNPVQAGVKTEILIADNGAIDRNWDPQQLSRGLISHGDVQIHGQAKTSHLKVATDPMAGDRTLILQEKPINWQVGDKLVLTGTRFIADTQGQQWDEVTEDEEVTIQAIDGDRITLDRALKYDHDTPRNDLKAYVANQSRNIVIATENADNLPNGQRGHTMFMHAGDIDIRYAEFRDLGRTDKTKRLDNFQDTGGVFPERILDGKGDPIVGDRNNIAGRYAAHLHRLGTNGDPAILVGNVVDGSPGWGFVVHDSSAILEKNVAYDVDGSAFVTESGNETGAFRNNISIKTGPGTDLGVIEKQGTGTHDFGRTGVGFWFQGRLVENENNVAAGSRNAGIFYFHRGVDLKPVEINQLPVPEVAKNLRGESSVTVDQAPIQGFKNNEVFASGNALHVIKDFPQQNHDLRTVLDGLKGWEVEKGTELQYTSHYTLNNFDLISSQDARFWLNKGLDLQKNVQDIVFNNMSARGFDKGISVQPGGGEGPTALDDRGLVWIDLKLENNKADFENFNLPPEKWLKKSSLQPGRLGFQLSNDSDFVVNGDDVGAYIDIRGTKTDSLGTIEMPFGDESITYNYNGARNLAKQGYYTLPDGTRATVIEEYFSDRVTGEVIKYPFIVKFNPNESWWTDDAPYLGTLDPNSIGGPTRTTLPESKFQLSPDPIVEVDPIIPTDPITPDPVIPVDPVNPDPVTPVDPVNPDPVIPVDPVNPDPVTPVDPVNPDPVTPVDPVNPDPVVPTDPVTPDPVIPPTRPIDTMNPTLASLKPVISYHFDTGQGPYAQDTSITGQNNQGELWNGTAWANGVDGTGLTMDGTGSLRLQNSTDLNLDERAQRSFSMWFKTDQITDDKQVLFEEGGASRGLNTYIDEEGLLYVGGWNQPQTESGWQGSWIASTEKVTDGQWHHVAIVLDGTDTVQSNALTAYLDGEVIGSDAGSQLWAHSGNVALGSIAGDTRFRDGVGRGDQGIIGSIDEAHIFNEALTGQQVQALATQFI